MAILNRALEEQRLEVPDAVQPNVTTFNAVIDTWVQSNRGREGAAKAEEILKLIIHWNQNEKSMQGGILVPDTRSYTTVLNAWARCEAQEQTGDAAKRAQEIPVQHDSFLPRRCRRQAQLGQLYHLYCCVGEM
jgi:hypothetical protein